MGVGADHGMRNTMIHKVSRDGTLVAGRTGRASCSHLCDGGNMLKKSHIAVLVAGALFTAQAGAAPGQFDDAIGWDESPAGSQQLTVFNPDGSAYSITPVEIPVILESDAGGAAAESLAPELVTVLDPDETSYSIVSGDIPLAMLEPVLLVAADEPLPQQVTVFEPGGLSYSYEFTPVEVTMLEPVDVVAWDDDISNAPVVLNDEDANLLPTYVAHFVSPPSYTGVLEERIS